LRKQGLLFDSALQAFSERLKALASERACDVLAAICGFHLE